MARKITVLLIEADLAVRDALQHALVVENHNVITASNAKEAWEKLRSERIDLALLDADFELPPQSSFLRQLRDSYPDLSTILMSNDGRFEAPDKGGDWMDKPLNLPLLFGKIEELAMGHA